MLPIVVDTTCVKPMQTTSVVVLFNNVHNLVTLASTETADGVSFNLAFESVPYNG